MGYKHLNIDERESILKMLSEQKYITHIAELLGQKLRSSGAGKYVALQIKFFALY